MAKKRKPAVRKIRSKTGETFESQTGGRGMICVLRADTKPQIDRFVRDLQDFCLLEELEEVEVMSIQISPGGGYEAIVRAHNANLFSRIGGWVQDRFRRKGKEEPEEEVFDEEGRVLALPPGRGPFAEETLAPVEGEVTRTTYQAPTAESRYRKVPTERVPVVRTPKQVEEEVRQRIKEPSSAVATTIRIPYEEEAAGSGRFRRAAGRAKEKTYGRAKSAHERRRAFKESEEAAAEEEFRKRYRSTAGEAFSFRQRRADEDPEDYEEAREEAFGKYQKKSYIPISERGRTVKGIKKAQREEARLQAELRRHGIQTETPTRTVKTQMPIYNPSTGQYEMKTVTQTIPGRRYTTAELRRKLEREKAARGPSLARRAATAGAVGAQRATVWTGMMTQAAAGTAPSFRRGAFQRGAQTFGPTGIPSTIAAPTPTGQSRLQMLTIPMVGVNPATPLKMRQPTQAPTRLSRRARVPSIMPGGGMVEV